MNCTRCGKPVDEHEAGRDTDACFAEVVMGLEKVTWMPSGLPDIKGTYWYLDDQGNDTDVPAFSRDIAPVWPMLEAYGDWDLTRHRSPDAVWASVANEKNEVYWAETPGDAAPLAIVRALMKAAISESAGG